MGLLNGEDLGTAFYDSFDGIGANMAFGTVMGVSSYVGISYAYGRNPFTNKVMWPDNNGFVETNPEVTLLKPGTMVDRYGSEFGTFIAPEGTPFNTRSLPNNSIKSPLNAYKVVKPIPVLKGTSSPSFWFGKPGGGIQFQLGYPVKHYIDNGYLIKIR